MTGRRGHRNGGMCSDCGLRRVSSKVHGPELCDVCLDYADIEVYHFDYELDEAHDYAGVDQDTCPVCNPNLDKRHEKRQGHTNTVAKSYTSHAGHHHARTPGDRALCRKSMATTGNPYDVRKK